MNTYKRTEKMNLREMNHYKNRKDQKTAGGRILAAGRCADDDDLHSGLNNNDLIIGCSGSGKTGSYVIPNIRRCHGSMIITDTKGQLYGRLGKDLTESGYKVYLIDFAEPERSMGYNPLDYIRKKAEQYNTKDIVSIATTLCPVRTEKDPFWESAAETVIEFLIAFAMEALVIEEHDMISVVDLFRQLSIPSGRQAMEQWCDDNPDSFAAKKYGMFKGIYEADRTWSCIQQFVSVALDVFDFAEIQSVFRCRDESCIINLEKIGEEKTAVFLNVSDTDRYADRLVNLFYTQAMQVLCRSADDTLPMGRLKVPVRFFLDDFAANTEIENFDKLISVIRSRNISVSVILQNMTQLYSMYSEAQASTILNNCDHILYLGGQDITTARYIGARANKTEENILLMPFDKAYLIEKGKPAELVDKIKPYAEEGIKKRDKL